MIIRSRAPARLAFGGGGTDISPYDKEKGGCVLNTTINKYIYGTLIPKFTQDVKLISSDYKRSVLFKDVSKLKYNGDLDLIKAVIKRMGIEHGMELFLRGDIPPNTGLGTSATAAVATIGLFNHLRKERKLNNYEVAELAYKIEDEEIKNKGGRQDQYASTFGGINFIEFKGGDFVRVNPVRVKRDHLLELEKHTILVYIGKRGSSGDVQKILIRQQKSYNKEEKIRQLDTLKAIAYEMHYCLSKGDLTTFGQLLGKAWFYKRKLNPLMTNRKIDNLYKLAIKYGALGGRITGAGGGGHMVFYCKHNKEHKVSKALEKKGARIIDFSFEKDGLQTWEVNHGGLD